MIHYPGPQLVPDALLAGRGAGERGPLWAVGDLGLLEAPSLVAVVGTRDPSPDALRRAGRLARELARAGSVVVSGLARGIDTAAHRGAIEAGGRTIAVLGTPLDQAWPPENAELQRLIMARHLALTQFPAGSTVHRSSFFRRNHTMALISDATEARMQERLPAWYRKGLNAPTFLLLPLQIKGRPFALIYADQERPGALAVDDKVLGLLRTLRNQAVMAFRQRT